MNIYIWYTTGKCSGDINNISEHLVMLFDWIYIFLIPYRDSFFFGVAHWGSFSLDITNDILMGHPWSNECGHGWRLGFLKVGEPKDQNISLRQ